MTEDGWHNWKVGDPNNEVPQVGQSYQLKIEFCGTTFFMYGHFDGTYWFDEYDWYIPPDFIVAFREWNKDFEE